MPSKIMKKRSPFFDEEAKEVSQKEAEAEDNAANKPEKVKAKEGKGNGNSMSAETEPPQKVAKCATKEAEGNGNTAKGTSEEAEGNGQSKNEETETTKNPAQDGAKKEPTANGNSKCEDPPPSKKKLVKGIPNSAGKSGSPKKGSEDSKPPHAIKIYSHRTKSGDMVMTFKSAKGDAPPYMVPIIDYLEDEANLKEIRDSFFIHYIGYLVDKNHPTEYAEHVNKNNYVVRRLVLVGIVPDDMVDNNTKEKRASWVNSFIKLNNSESMQQNYKYNGKALYEGDNTEKVPQPLSSFLPIRDVMEVIEKAYDANAKDIMEDDDILQEYYEKGMLPKVRSLLGYDYSGGTSTASDGGGAFAAGFTPFTMK